MLSLTRPVLKKNYITKTNTLGFYQSLANMEEVKYPTPSPFSLPVSPMGRGY